MSTTFAALCAASTALYKTQCEIESLFKDVENARNLGMSISADLRQNIETSLAKFCQALRDYERLKRSYFASNDAKKALLLRPNASAPTTAGELLASLS